ncbi:MAG: peptide chain release factor 2 [bacterium]|nr:peptide chain release factor 2 [bacterium]
MRAETQNLVDEIKGSLALLRRHLDWDTAKQRLQALNEQAEDPTLWDDSGKARKVMRERQRLEIAITAFERLERELVDNSDMISLGEDENDDEVVVDAENALKILHKETLRRETEALLSGEADGNDTYLEINAGAGGTEAQDWAEMMMRMYIRWAEQHAYKVQIIETSAGEEAGIKSATLHFKGEDAYGWMKTESGVHRLVRISPFDSSARRHTSFASVWVYPVVDENIEIEINESDCRIDTYRASGAGGQHVNTTDSAVRITHVPTNIVVQCQSQRSQHKNKDTAWSMLKARLYEEELKKREEESQAQAAQKTDIGWGHQIRSYVLQPYQMVKDLRTGVESTNPPAVLDGDLDQFISAALAQRVNGTGEKITDLD